MKTGSTQQLRWLIGTFLCCSFVVLVAMDDAHGRGTADARLANAGVMSVVITYSVSAPPDSDDGPTEEEAARDESAPPSGLRELTPEEISRLRYMELRGLRLEANRADPREKPRPDPQPDRVSVKISRETIDEFLQDVEDHPDFRGEKDRRAFRKMTSPQKLHHIAFYKGVKYADKVEIKSDPEVFVTFRKSVMPAVLRGCLTSGCHASADDGARTGFRMFKDPKKRPGTTYANFVMLTETEVGPYRLIDRAQPEDSLLLTFLLPAKDVEPAQRHPGNLDLKPLFRSRKALGFRRIADWIANLKHPQEDYGIRFSARRQDGEPDDDHLPRRPAVPTDEKKRDADNSP